MPLTADWGRLGHRVDSLNDGNSFEVACHPELLTEAMGAVNQVVAMTTWPVPRALSSSSSTSAPDVHPDAYHAAD